MTSLTRTTKKTAFALGAAVLCTGVLLAGCTRTNTPAQAKADLLKITPKQAHDFMQFTKNHGGDIAVSCVHPDLSFMEPAVEYKAEMKRCVPTFKKMSAYWADHGISGVTDKVLQDNAVLKAIAKQNVNYVINGQ